MKELLEFIARRLVDHPDAVEVDVDIEDDDVILTLSVDEQDMGRVIGRDGRVANSIRSLLRVVGTRSGQHVELEITGNE
ncbi:MAG TPA: KH domain-containing protein [Candidatus Limnocylindria bacterium]|nr:KH domain-containing protein [Candidatus Limnocylindria bacterium]